MLSNQKKQKEQINFRVDKKLKEEFNKAAEKKGMSQTEVLTRLMTLFVQENYLYLKKESSLIDAEEEKVKKF